MKKTVIGGILTCIGSLISLSIIILAAFEVPDIHEWRGSKLDEAINSLSLGFPLIIGILFLIMGLIVLAIEYFRTD